jgi:hypothetical protein
VLRSEALCRDHQLAALPTRLRRDRYRRRTLGSSLNSHRHRWCAHGNLPFPLFHPTLFGPWWYSNSIHENQCGVWSRTQIQFRPLHAGETAERKTRGRIPARQPRGCDLVKSLATKEFARSTPAARPQALAALVESPVLSRFDGGSTLRRPRILPARPARWLALLRTYQRPRPRFISTSLP